MNLREILDFQLFTLSGTVVTVATLITALIILLAAFWVSRLVERALRRVFRRKADDSDPSFAVVTRLSHYAIVLVGFAMALDTIGFSLGALFAAGAVFAVGLGFAMQNIAQNFVSGVILLLERSIKPGDVVAVEGKVVRVLKLGIRTTIARTRDDEELIIPNSALVQSTVKNYTLHDSIFRIRALVGVVYSSDMRLVMETLTRVTSALEWRSQTRPPRILLTEFGSSSVNFDASVWIDDPWEAPASLTKLHDAIWWALKDAGIVIAFPQLDVHFDGGIESSFADLARAPAA